MVSDASLTVILSIRSQMPAVAMAISSTKPGLMPVPNIDEPPCSQAVDDAVAVGAEAPPVDERRGADDVDAGLEDADELVDVRPHRVVDDAVGPQREQRVDVVGGGDADRVDAAQLADVAADLVRRPGVAADQLEVGVGDDGPHRPLADVARRPLHHSQRHRRTPRVERISAERMHSTRRRSARLRVPTGWSRPARRGARVVGAAGPACDRGAGSGAQGALLRPGLLPARVRAAVAPGLADGVPARGDPGAG